MRTQDDRAVTWETVKEAFINQGGLTKEGAPLAVSWEDLANTVNAILAHERQLKPVQADDLIRRSELIEAVGEFIGTKFEDRERNIFDVINTIPAISNTEAVAWRWKPKDSNIWIYNPDIDWLNSRNDVDKEPLFTAPPQPQSVKDALEAAAKIAEDATKRTQFQTVEHYKIAAFISKHIRALITDKKEG